jgi:hypothetical protein
MTAARSPRVLYLERPCFWTEPGDPEVWFRALEAISTASDAKPQTGTPRTVAERCLVRIIAWRGAVGLFGVVQNDGEASLQGIGLVARNADGTWSVTDEGQALIRLWRESTSNGLTQLAAYLVRESAWLRLLLLRLLEGDWKIDNWAHARSSRAGLKAGSSLRLERYADESKWFAEIDQKAAGRWLARTNSSSLDLAPGIAARKKGKDDLSLSPLTAPLHLLETVGWLSPLGVVQLPSAVHSDLVGHLSAAEALSDISVRRADVRGFVAAEVVLRELLATFGASPTDEEFTRWMDELLDSAVSTGSLEILSAEPGQARHGRGLFGDSARKLVRWVVHQEFNDRFQSAWAALGIDPNARRHSPGVGGEELKR